MGAEYGFPELDLDARIQSTGIYTATKNSTTTSYFTFGFDCMFNGLEILVDANALLGDTLSLETQYDAGEFGWKRYKKFVDGFLICPGSLHRYILFPTKPTSGVRIELQYTSTGATNDVKYGLNLFTYADTETVNPGALEEGTDW